MILEPGASREQGGFDRRCHSIAQRQAAGLPQGGGRRRGGKSWLALVAVLGLVATLLLWLTELAVPTGAAAPLASHQQASPVGAREFTFSIGAARSTSPASSGGAEALVVDTLSEADIRILQAKLTALGYEPGAIDGVAGGRTLDALNQYRESKRLGRAYKIHYSTVADLLD